MASIHDYDLPAPKVWERFEDLIWDLFQETWGDPHAQKVGTLGQAQHGVDVFGHPDRGPELEGVQCKRNDDRPSEAELRQMVEHAKEFQPPLDSFVVATSAASDTRVQQLALVLSRANQQAGSFRVTVMGWNEIQRRLRNYPHLISKYYGNLFPPAAAQVSEAPRLTFGLRDEGEQPGKHGPQRVVSLVAENRGGGIVSEFMFQMQVPFVPPDVTQPNSA